MRGVEMDSITLQPVGQVRSERREPEDDHWDTVEAFIELDGSRFDDEALRGLDSFSHVEVIFLMNQVEGHKICMGSRHPRNNSDWPRVGIFAQRAKSRPNCLGLTTCTVVRVEGLRLYLRGLDAIDGTPVLDLKPTMTGFSPRGPQQEPPWAAELMSRYWD